MGQLLEVCHDKGINYFNILVVLSSQMILHQSDFLSQQINFLFELSHLVSRILNNVGDVLELGLHVVLVGGSQAGR